MYLKRVFFLFLSFFFSAQSFSQQRIDAKGADGLRGQRGSHGSNGGIFSGRNGNPGYPGSAGSDGEDAKDVELNIRTSNNDYSTLEITGEIIPRSTDEKSAKQPFTFITSKVIEIDARGGDGGIGGDGGDGGAGSKGRDASGDDDGGDGGNGGNGGAGGRGGNAGDGGNVKIRVSHQDSYTLKNLKIQFSAGKEGPGGKGGVGGNGGRGGSGGSGEVSISIDADGDPQTTIGPGGSDGSDGRQGVAGMNGPSGLPANNGSVEFILKFEDGSERTFHEIFDLQLLSLDIEEKTSPDGVFEPGEEIYISNLKVKNIGGMPTPPVGRAYMRIEPRSEKWLIENNLINSEGYLKIPEVIQPGETYTFNGPVFSFVIDDFVSHEPSAEALKFLGMQIFRARVTEVDQPFESFDKARQFLVRYPVELTTVHAAPALKIGDKSFGALQIRNLSNRSIGSLGDIKRGLGVDLGISHASGEGIDIQFVGEDAISADKTHHDLPSIEPHQTIKVPFVVDIKENYSGDDWIGVEGSLLFDTINEGNREIQRLKHTVRLVESFDQNIAADVILVTHQNTSRNEINSWRNQCQQLGLKVAIWNVSFYANFDLFAKILGKNNEKIEYDLPQALRGKIVVVFGGKFSKWGSPEEVDAFDYLSYKQIATMAHDYESNFLFYGFDKERNSEIRNILFGRDWEEITSTSVSEFKTLFAQKEPRDFGGASHSQIKLNKSNLRYSSVARVYKINLSNNYYFGEPNESEVEVQANEVMAFLKKHDSARQYAVSTHPLIQNERPKGYFQSGRYNLGYIEVRALPVATDQPYVLADRVGESEIIKTLVPSLHFKTRLRTIDSLMNFVSGSGQADDEETQVMYGLEVLLSSVIYDLSYELDAATFSTTVFRDQPEKRLPLHKLLAEYKFKSALRKESKASPIFVRFLARMHLLKHYIYTSRSLCYGYIPVTQGLSVAWFAENFAQSLKAHLFVDDSDFDNVLYSETWTREFKAAMVPLDETSKWYHGFYWRNSKRSAVYNYLRQLNRSTSLVTTHDVWMQNFIAPLSGETMNQYLNAVDEKEKLFDQFTDEQLNQRRNLRNVKGEADQGSKDFDY